jgi:hypothetical protein
MEAVVFLERLGTLDEVIAFVCPVIWVTSACRYCRVVILVVVVVVVTALFHRILQY